MIKRVSKSSVSDSLEPAGGRGGTASHRVPNRSALAPIVSRDRPQPPLKNSTIDSSPTTRSKPFQPERMRKLATVAQPGSGSEGVRTTLAGAAAAAEVSEKGLPAIEDGDEKADSSERRRIQSLECTIEFLRKQHAELMSALHAELDSAKRQIQELQFRLVMAEEQIILRRRRSAFEQNRTEERRLKKEKQANELAASSYCAPTDKVALSLSGSAWAELPRSPVQKGVRLCAGKQTDKRQQTKKNKPGRK